MGHIAERGTKRKSRAIRKSPAMKKLRENALDFCPPESEQKFLRSEGDKSLESKKARKLDSVDGKDHRMGRGSICGAFTSPHFSKQRGDMVVRMKIPS